MLLKLDVVLAAVDFILLGHGQLGRRNEVKRRVEVAHGHDERMHCAAVFQVTYQIDVKIVECALSLKDRVEVEQTLRGMHVGTVAGVDDGHGGHL